MNIWNQMRPSTKDRILFLVIGALLATVAYIAGNTVNSVDADSPTVFEDDVWIKGKLLVSSGSIVIKEPSNTKSYIDLHVGQGSPIIRLMNGTGQDPSNKKSYIDLHVKEGASIMRLVNGKINNSRTAAASELTLVAHDGVKFPSSSILLSGKNGKDEWSMWSFLPK